MIEQDISDLYGKIEDLENKLDKVIRSIETNDFYWEVATIYGNKFHIIFSTKEEAEQWIEDQKTRDKSRFKKGSCLRGFLFEDILTQRKLLV